MNKNNIDNNDIGNYEADYHQDRHKYLFTDDNYYKARSELSYLRYFKSIPEVHSKRILEFGCGLGQNLFWLPAARRIGYDISDFATTYFKLKGGRATKDIDKIPNDSFDIILSAHVLEHVENPLETLSVVHSKLRKGGKLILITPLEVPKKLKTDEMKPDINQHLWTWTPQLMVNLLEKSGFAPVENKIIYTCGHKKLLFMRKMGVKIYSFTTSLAGRILRKRELKMVAIKR